MKHPLIIAAVLLIGLINLSAEESTAKKDNDKKPTTPEEIVVTASRYPTSLKDTPAKVIVINEQEINQAGAGAIDQVIKLQPQALELFPVFALRQKREINLRGFSDSGHTLILLDGIPLYSAEEEVPWNLIPSEAVERVEIVPGAFSSIYGSGAMGGVINIITKNPKKKRYHRNQ